MTTLATIALYVLAFIGALSVLSSVGVFIMTWRMTDDPPMPASEVVARHTGNVRVLPRCGCGDGTTLGVVHRAAAPCYVPTDAS